MSTTQPEVMHALLEDTGQALVPGRLYPTLCGTEWEYQRLGATEVRTRFVCALCHREQIEFLRNTLNELIGKYNEHLRQWHPENVEPPVPKTPEEKRAFSRAWDERYAEGQRRQQQEGQT